MFKKIQNYLLINHPLLWNTKIVPAFSVAVLFHIIFFLIGYGNGGINFHEKSLYEFGFDTGIIVFFSILVTLLFFVMWFLYYMRNNAIKAFYPVSVKSLYLEWLIIMIVCVLNLTYSVSYTVGKSLKIRSYYTEAEAERRLTVISMAGVFVDGGFNTPPHPADSVDKAHGGDKRYPAHSLFYREAEYSRHLPIGKTDSIVKGWMEKNDQQAIKKLMRDYMQIVAEHKLPTNLTAESWFQKTYDYPTFTKYEIIGRQSKEHLIPNHVVSYSGSDYQYYVPQAVLSRNYAEIHSNWNEPLIAEGLIYTLLYMALSLAMMLFSFRITNARSWLLALVTMGALWILAGVLSALSRSSFFFLYFWLFVALGIVLYFFVTTIRNRGKENSAIVLNLLLWSLAGMLPLLYFLVMEYFNKPEQIVTSERVEFVNTPQYQWMDDNVGNFLMLNIWIIIAAMILLTAFIRKWKSVAES